MELHEEVTGVFARMDALIDELGGTDLRIDVHTHLGLDEDGMSQTLEELVAHLDSAGVARAVTFPLHDPDRGENYTVPNDRVIDWCEASEGRVVPFCRLNLTGDPEREARRAIERGARGIKLHPRAQAFSVDDERLAPVFEIAAEYRLPILIHAGRGMPPIGEALSRLAERNPDATLILAHAAIVDQDRIASLVAGRPNVVFDASAWSPIDIHGLLTRVPPEQLVWASDLPYGTIRESLFATLAVLCEVGADRAMIDAVLGGTTEKLLEGEHPVLSSAPIAPRDRVVNLARQRLGGYLTALLPVLWQRRPDYVGHFGLAAAVCRDEEEQLGGIGDLIRIGERRWDQALASGDRPTLEDVRETFEIILAAWVLSYSPATHARWNELPA